MQRSAGFFSGGIVARREKTGEGWNWRLNFGVLDLDQSQLAQHIAHAGQGILP